MRRVECGPEDLREVVVRHAGNHDEIIVDGEHTTVRIHQFAPGRFVLDRNGGRELFHCVREGDTIHLFWRGRAYRLRDLGEGRRPTARGSTGGLEAPMPGKVISVAVDEGQSVAKGDVILVIEAMKMENSVRAPRAGRVKLIATSVGEAVAPGRVLVELEP